MKSSLRRRFIFPLIVSVGVILALIIGYHIIIIRSISESKTENTILAADNLNQQISAEFKQMNTVTSVIAESEFVRDFLREQNIVAFYEKADVVSEIVRKAAFPISSSDSVITISENGRFYRFSGTLSNNSLEKLYESFKDAETVYTVTELDGVLFFCHSAPIIDYSEQNPSKLGNIIILTGLEKTRRQLDYGDDVDRTVIFGENVILSNNTALEGLHVGEIGEKYGVVITSPIEGTRLTVAAAIPNDALSAERILFYSLVVALICLLIIMIVFAEHQKLFESRLARQNMRINLLSSQMNAHFVVNTLKSVKSLSDSGESSKAGRMADGLAAILQHQHKGDKPVNVFDDFSTLEKYIDIMNIKFNEKFNIEYLVEDNLETCVMPCFILQPIAENALTHGLGGKEKDARLTIKGFISGNSVIFEISDNGAGIPPEKLKEIQDSLSVPQAKLGDFPKQGLRGVALVNVQRRIRLLYGDDYGVKIESEVGKGTTVTVALPLISD